MFFQLVVVRELHHVGGVDCNEISTLNWVYIVSSLDSIIMSYVANGDQPDMEQPQVRLKKIAAKTVHMKSPPPRQPSSNGNDNLSTRESFKSAVTAEIVGENVAIGDNGAVNVETDDVMPPARLVASLSSPQPPPSEPAKKVKSTPKNPPKKKSNSTKPLKGGFWEVEGIVDVRKNGKTYEFLVQWKGDYENTWEPQKCLNKNALRDAKELIRAKKKQLNEGEVVVSAVSDEEVQGLHELGDENS